MLISIYVILQQKTIGTNTWTIFETSHALFIHDEDTVNLDMVQLNSFLSPAIRL